MLEPRAVLPFLPLPGVRQRLQKKPGALDMARNVRLELESKRLQF